jgi:hypothetical protein
MSDWGRTERVTTEVIYTVQARPPWGACWNQVQQALSAAIREYGIISPKGGEPSDDAIRIHPLDDRIEIIFQKERPRIVPGIGPCEE